MQGGISMKVQTILKTFMFFFAFFFALNIINASTEYVVFLDAVNIRTGPGTNYSRIKLGLVGSTYNLKSSKIIADENNNGSCDAGWYNIDADGENGYICSTYVRAFIDGAEEKTEPTSTCEADLKAAGFPASYWQGLCSLKSKYPNWQFKALNTRLDFATAVDKFTSCGSSLLSNPNSAWLDKSCTYKEGSFVTVNQSGVAYYLDPRNFLNENYIFQFESNKYNSNLENIYPTITKSIIEGTSFYKYHQGLGNDLAEYISQAGKETDTNPAHLASRMYQELGTGTTLKNLYQGTFNDYIRGTYYDFRGYYNFYNIGVTGYCVTQGMGSTYCGLNKAKSMGWNSVYNAVKGGGSFLRSDYIGAGQYTAYLERFNVVPTDATKMYIHYYMANLQAPSSEANKSYQAYKKANLLNSAFEFYIPVYNNMDGTIENNSSGAVGGENFSEPTSTSINSVITSAGFRLSGNNILGINPNTSSNTIKNNLEAISGSNTVTISGTSSGIIATGSTITIKNSEETKSFTVVIKGDTSGDGKINALDLLQVQKNILGNYNLKAPNSTAGDTSGDGKINALDLLQIQKNILGTNLIEQ